MTDEFNGIRKDRFFTVIAITLQLILYYFLIILPNWASYLIKIVASKCCNYVKYVPQKPCFLTF